jgi:hypothetical protein
MPIIFVKQLIIIEIFHSIFQASVEMQKGQRLRHY